tara:strand:- start:78695 stop:79390 length:696 start_codon:yes stop_codon:yes gene_type:complete
MNLSAEILGLFVGKIETLWPGKPSSAIAKVPATSVLQIEELGFVGDSQADLRVHGGPEKALHHYASEHMEYWREQFPDSVERFRPGCFGENISTVGIDEHNLCIGDVLSLGTATVQVCQGRQPCWKLNSHLGIKELAKAFQTSARTGWYYRVLKSGHAGVGDRIELIDRLNPDWPLVRVIEARFNPRLELSVARELAALSQISERWRDAFTKKSVAGFKENTDSRLKGESD